MDSYKYQLRSNASSNSSDTLGNLGVEHAKIALETIFEKAIIEGLAGLKVLAGTLSEKTFKLSDFEFYIISMTNSGLSPRIEICLTDIVKLEDANEIVNKLYENEHVEIRFLEDQAISHFAVVGNSYRFELDRELMKADVCFSDETIATRLDNLFGKVFNAANPLV